MCLQGVLYSLNVGTPDGFRLDQQCQLLCTPPTGSILGSGVGSRVLLNLSANVVSAISTYLPAHDHLAHVSHHYLIPEHFIMVTIIILGFYNKTPHK